jgi:hypothetical protein
MRRIWMISLAGIASIIGVASAQADSSYHSAHIALAPISGAPLRSGFVENIHANGPNVFAHEQYVVNGAEPHASYQVVLMIFPGDTACASSPITIPTAVITTNVAGNGSAYHVFRPADAEGLHGLTVGGMWVLEREGTPEYTTSCAVIHLD